MKSENNEYEEILHIVKRVNKRVRSNIKSIFDEYEITGVQSMVLKTLKYRGPMKISELSDIVSLSNSTMSGVVDRLEKRKYVVRERSEKDRRIVMVKLNEAFVKEIDTKLNLVGEFWQSILDRGSEEEIEKILEGLKALELLLDRR